MSRDGAALGMRSGGVKRACETGLPQEEGGTFFLKHG